MALRENTRTIREDYTFLSERALAGSGIGNSPEVIAGLIDLQRRATDQSADSGDIADAADAAQSSADAAQAASDAAQVSADDAGQRANTAQQRADAAYTLADGKVTKTTITAPSNYSGTATATYTQADEQALRDQVAALTAKVQAIVAALKV